MIAATHTYRARRSVTPRSAATSVALFASSSACPSRSPPDQRLLRTPGAPPSASTSSPESSASTAGGAPGAPHHPPPQKGPPAAPPARAPPARRAAQREHLDPGIIGEPRGRRARDRPRATEIIPRLRHGVLLEGIMRLDGILVRSRRDAKLGERQRFEARIANQRAELAKLARAARRA